MVILLFTDIYRATTRTVAMTVERIAQPHARGGGGVGNLPWVDLAVPEVDAWGRRFLYRGTPSFADDVGLPTVAPGSCPPTPPAAPPSQASFALCSDGNINIVDGAGGNPVASKIPAVIVSYGANGGVAPTSLHETENRPSGPNPTIFVSKGYSQNPGSEFDDLVAWISPHILKNRMIAAGRLP